MQDLRIDLFGDIQNCITGVELDGSGDVWVAHITLNCESTQQLLLTASPQPETNIIKLVIDKSI